jgi:hypothetical protein
MVINDVHDAIPILTATLLVLFTQFSFVSDFFFFLIIIIISFCGVVIDGFFPPTTKRGRKVREMERSQG